MKHITLAALLLGLATSAQAQSARATPRPPIEVQVVDGRVVVSDPGVRTSAGEVVLSWALATPGYRFTASSMNFGDAEDFFSCVPFSGGAGIRCTKSADAPSGRLRYSISLAAEPGSAPLGQMNPVIWIQNE